MEIWERGEPARDDGREGTARTEPGPPRKHRRGGARRLPDTVISDWQGGFGSESGPSTSLRFAQDDELLKSKFVRLLLVCFAYPDN